MAVCCSTAQATPPAAFDDRRRSRPTLFAAYRRTTASPWYRQRVSPSHPGRLVLAPSSLAFAILVIGCCCCCISLLPSVDAIVSYCRDPTPASYSLAQAEVVCDINGLYRFPVVNDKGSSGHRLYDDLGKDNNGKRYTAMTLDESTAAKYANMSEYVLHVLVLNANRTATLHHCCRVCYLDCEQFRNECPRRNVSASDPCIAAINDNPLCRFTESVLEVRVQLVCAIKASKNRAIPESWYTSGFTLRTSPPGCPYRRLESGSYYLLLASLATPSQGSGDELVGADMIVALPKKLRGQPPTAFLRGIDLRQSGFDYLRNGSALRNDSRCPDRRSLAARSGAASAILPKAASGGLALKAVAAAAAVAAIVGSVTSSSAEAVGGARAPASESRRGGRRRTCSSDISGSDVVFRNPMIVAASTAAAATAAATAATAGAEA